MRRYFRHIVGPIAFLIIMGATVYFVTSTGFGKLTIDIVEWVGGFSVEYRNIEGNILQGFRIDDYSVKLSETDSVYGKRAGIYYRFNLFMLQLPNLFEVNLTEPTIEIEAKKEGRERRVGGLPNIRLGLRVNLKNGKVRYKNERVYEAERISGIVFADFVGSRIHLLTRNLSLHSPEYSLAVRSLNLDADVDNEMVRVKSLKMNGDGFILRGSGIYIFDPESLSLDIKEARVELKKLDLHDGVVEFVGNVTYSRGNLMPQIRGNAYGVLPLDRFGFETNAAADTIWVNVFDAELLEGLLFAQLKVVRMRGVELAANFRDLDISRFLGTTNPVITNGYLAYSQDRFRGFISTQSERGFGLDSVVYYGTFSGSELYLDSLFVIEEERTLSARGAVIPKVDLHLAFADFDFTRFEEFFGLRGNLSGTAQIVGEPRDLLGLSLTSDLTVRDLYIHGFSADTVTLKTKDFQRHRKERDLSVAMEGIRYRNYAFERTQFWISDSTFNFAAFEKADTILIDGILRDDLGGTIHSLIVNYNRVLTRNTKPIDFDIVTGMVGDVQLAFADGTLEFSKIPLTFRLDGIDLHKMGKLLGLRADVRGSLDVVFVRDSITMYGRDITFMGLENGYLEFRGRYADKGITIDSLHIHDAMNQILDARGIVSLEHSDLRANFKDVGVWVLAFLEKFLGEPSGLMTGEVTFRGNIERFEFGGGGKIHDASFSVGIIASRFDSIITDVRFEGDRILFTSGKGIMSPMNGRKLTGQWISGGGVVKLERRFGVNNLNFDFSFIDAPIQFPPFAYGIGSGNFSLNMRDRITHYNGNIRIKEAIVPIEFGMKIEEEQATRDDNWRMNLTLRGERDIWLRNRDADIGFGGELNITKETGPVQLSGVLETERGNYYWLNHILSITQGKVTFAPEDEIDPDVDFWAEMDTREGVKVILHMFGPISEPIFEFFTEPPGQYTEQDILTYLNLNITWQELEQIKRGEYMSKIIPRSLLSWLEGDVSRAIREYTGLDYFRIEAPFFEADERTKLTVGKYISRNLFVTYTYDITTFSNEFNVEYFIDDKNKIHVERDDTGEFSLQYQYRLRF
ncbi:MAG: translocation/assembly module TamB domain-containing protein [candidate division WOR-3 bacterium]|nr:MAG: translocation/assembly module TamB domain-containing protein [candidate division WOR-3 bacterium]